MLFKSKRKVCNFLNNSESSEFISDLNIVSKNGSLEFISYKDQFGIGTQINFVNTRLNDELDNFGNNGPVVVQQSKEERDAKAEKVYLGNVKVVWTNGTNVEVAPRDAQPQAAAAPQPAAQVEDDLPF